MKPSPLDTILHWLKTNPGIFSFYEQDSQLEILEWSSHKKLKLRATDIHQSEIQTNSANAQESYCGILFEDGRQIILSAQGFAFPPDFRNSGPLPLPNAVYCLRDFETLFHQLRHLASEEDRRRDAADLVLVLIAILDGAALAGLDVSLESGEVEKILTALEQGKNVPHPHHS